MRYAECWVMLYCDVKFLLSFTCAISVPAIELPVWACARYRQHLKASVSWRHFAAELQQSGSAVIPIDDDLNQRNPWMSVRFHDGGGQLPCGLNLDAEAVPFTRIEHIHELCVCPILDVVVWAIVDLHLNRVTSVMMQKRGSDIGTLLHIIAHYCDKPSKKSWHYLLFMMKMHALTRCLIMVATSWAVSWNDPSPMMDITRLECPVKVLWVMEIRTCLWKCIVRSKSEGLRVLHTYA